MYKRTIVFIAALLTACLNVIAQPAAPVTLAQPVSVAKHISSGREKTTILIFPAAIAEGGVDRGHPWISTAPVQGVANVLKVKAETDALPASNLTVITADGRVYVFTVSYSADPAQTVIDLSAEDGHPRALFNAQRMNDAAVERTCEIVAATNAHRRRPVSRVIGGMRLRVSNLFLKDGVMFFKLKVDNTSGLDYTTSLVRAYVRDRKQRKRTSSMEQQLQPLRIHFVDRTVQGGGNGAIVIALERFTIADNKLFFFEVFEQNGDRVMQLKFRGKHLLKVRTF